MYKQTMRERLMMTADLQGEVLPKMPLIEIAGSNQVLIENHEGVTQYSSCCIHIKAKYGQICVQGCNMTLSRMTRDQLIISGQIDSVHLIRG